MTLPTLRSSRPVTFPRGPAANSPTRASSAGTPASGPSGGSILAMLTLFALLFGLLVVVPIVILANGTAPEAVLGWWAMIGVSWAITEWSERRRQRLWLKQHGRPKPENNPVGAAFQRRWGLAEESYAKPEKTPPRTARMHFCEWVSRRGAPDAENASAAPVPLYVIDPPGWGRNADYPEVLEARQAGILEVIEDEFERAKAAGLQGEDLTRHLAHVIGGARLSKTAAGQSRVSGGGEPRLGRGGLKGYLEE